MTNKKGANYPAGNPAECGVVELEEGEYFMKNGWSAILNVTEKSSKRKTESVPWLPMTLTEVFFEEW